MRMREKHHLRAISHAVVVLASLAVLPWAIAGSRPVTVGSFSFQLPDGWERAPESVEKDAGGFLFAHTKGKEADAEPVVVIFLPNGTPFKNETERAAILERLREGIKAKHAASYKAWKVQLAGVETQRLRFVENGQTIFYLLPYNGEQILTIIVTVPRPYAPFPNEVNTSWPV
mgnify:CR=1 FL=1